MKGNFGAAMRSRREDMGITQQALADMVGVRRQTIASWEKGASLPDLLALGVLEKALEVKEGEFFAYFSGSSENPTPPAEDTPKE